MRQIRLRFRDIRRSRRKQLERKRETETGTETETERGRESVNGSKRVCVVAWPKYTERHYKGASFTRKRIPVGPNCRPMRRILGGS